MISREQLASLDLEELKELASKYGITPLGNWGKREAWITAIVKAPMKAVEQVKDGIGLTAPDGNAYLLLTTVIDSLGKPTTQQLSLIKMTRDKVYFNEIEFHSYQLRLEELHRARLLLLEVVRLLAG